MLIYDRYLEKALRHLFDHWLEENVGLVAAALIDGDKVIYATSVLNANGTWKHAERNALEQFEVTHGNPGQGAVMLSTLSPCTRDAGSGTTYGDQKNAVRRQDESCSSLLKQHGITTIGFGALDDEDAKAKSIYIDRGFSVIDIQDRTILATCTLLNSMFPAYIETETSGTRGCAALKKQLLESPQCPKTFFERRDDSSGRS